MTEATAAALRAPAAAPPPVDEFQALYRQHFGYVFNTLRRLVTGSSDAEDLCHEVFLVAYRRLAEYDRSRPIQPWLFGIAYRVASDFRRRARSRPEVLHDEPPELEDHQASSEAQLIESQRRQTVLKALDELDLEQRAAISLCDFDGLSGPEAAAALEIPLNTLYSRLRTARQQFSAAVRRRALIQGET